jgi:hypothetical protein
MKLESSDLSFLHLPQLLLLERVQQKSYRDLLSFSSIFLTFFIRVLCFIVNINYINIIRYCRSL